MDTPSKPHQKHAKLAKPAHGNFHRHEWAIVGAPCPQIQHLVGQLMSALEAKYRFGYVDADHGSGADGEKAVFQGSRWTYTDKIDFHRVDMAEGPDTFSARQMCNHLDAVLVNGNHYKANKQIVIVHPDKEDSLRRKLDRLTDIQLVLLAEGARDIFPFLRERLGEQHRVPIMRLNDLHPVHEWFASQMEKSRAPLFGLVLAGGESTRMGEDKGKIAYHGKAQRERTADLLSLFCEEVFYSVRPEQQDLPEDGKEVIRDKYLGLGPYGGLLSAFQAHPDAAWFTLATDLPLIDETSLAQLLGMRDASRFATAFHNSETRFPEPLITIWEPRSYPRLLEFLAQGYSCPRKVLINSDIELVDPANPESLINVNKPAERKAMEKRLASETRN